MIHFNTIKITDYKLMVIEIEVEKLIVIKSNDHYKNSL